MRGRNRWTKLLIVAVAFAGLAVSAPMGAGAQTNVERAQPNVWATHNAQSLVQVDQSVWRQFVTNVTDGDGDVRRVAYVGFDAQTRRFLDAYIEAMSALRPSEWSRDVQLAYWLNLHNAATIRLLDRANGRGPIDRHRSFPETTSGPFAERTLMIEGRALSVDAIVNEVLRPNFRDVPFLYGVFFGAIGGPRLVAFDGRTVRAELDAEARRFVNDRGVRAAGDALELSTFYQWYGEDFGGPSGVLTHVRGLASPALLARLEGREIIRAYRFNRNLAAVIPRNVNTDSLSANRPSTEQSGGGS